MKRILLGLLLACMAAPALSAPRDPLLDGFRKPPAAAKPRVWWHWMNGNVTKDGIRKDLDWMKRVGIGGVDAIDASIETPQVVDRRLVYMTPEWKDAFRHAAKLADTNGMELAIDSSPGWSETGGPWVTPQAAMKKLVWSRTAVDGAFHGLLPQPPSVTGPFQNIAKNTAAPFYRDTLVIAYRVPVADPQGAVTASGDASVDAATLRDGDLANGVTLAPATPDAEVWLRVAYDAPQTIQALTLALSTNDGLGFAARVDASDDGQTWRVVADVPKAAQVRRFALLQQTIAFAPVTARYFRLVVRPGAPIPNSLRIVDRAPGLADAPSAPVAAAPRFYKLHELVFHAQARINEFEKKAGFAIARDNYAIAATAAVAPGSAVSSSDVLNVSAFMTPDGRFDWAPPSGHWVVLRLGYSLTGSENHPATREATGLEVDKLNARHVRDYMEHYLDTYAHTVGPSLFGKRGLNALMVDSTEVGAQNWTETMLADFQRLRGYDATPWLPALTGIVINSAAASDRFLWDWRRTIAQLLSENHYGEIARIAKERRLLDYAEALEDHRPTFGDDLEMRSHAAIPTAAMWAYGARPLPTYVADIQGAASVAHVYGRTLVAAESLTSAGQPWTYSPRTLKPVVDLEFATGVNRIIVHTSVHQPVDKAPGLSLGGYGQFFNRLDSWAGMAGDWVRYIARCSFLLQQGRHAADIAYFPGEEAPITGLFGDKPVDVPPGYGFDFVGADALLRLVSVKDGDVVTPSGMRYRLIYLGGSSRLMTLPVLQRLRELVEQGAVLVGEKPQASPSLADDGAVFQALADNLFGADRFGKGRIFAALPQAFAALTLAPDFEYTKPRPDSELLAAHRHLDDGELYFISNRRGRAETFDITLRASGMRADLLDAVTGTTTQSAVTSVEGRSRITLSLPAHGSVFVRLRPGATAVPPRAPQTVAATITGPWRIAFQRGRGAPVRLDQKTLQSWSETDAAKYFSGTATYTAGFTLAALKRGATLMLDLGDVREVAEVSVNGKAVGTAWTAPFALDISKAARCGRNTLTIKVANLWVNRLIGDAQPGARKIAFTTIPTFRADAPLRPSGLLGPVTIHQTP